MNASLLFVLLALLAGAFVPFQTGGNTILTKSLGSGFYASLVVFIVAALTIAIVIMLQRQSIPTTIQMQSAPLYSWFIGGVLGAAYIFLLIYLAPKLGIANVTGFVVAGQLITAIVFDHFGLLHFPVHPINWQRLAGIALLLSGLFLIKKY
ncbi:MAG: DMT family transporter [Bacteroidia bacterium]|nr:DMT family transporter [Bacteroidia bacterium]